MYDGPGPILVNGEGLCFSAKSVEFLSWVNDPTTNPLTVSADLEILLFGALILKLSQLPADLQISTSYSSCISSKAFAKSEN